jgi:Ni,Fe-hydrogenase III large subunit/Ni,Fe-hydrogenase III component G
MFLKQSSIYRYKFDLSKLSKVIKIHITQEMNTLLIKNNQSVDVSDIPVYDYEVFYAIVVELMTQPQNHCVNYYAFPKENSFKFICCIADDKQQNIHVFSHEISDSVQALDAISRDIYAMQGFEREIAENFGIDFLNHPWAKPFRYAYDRADRTKKIENYPFLSINGVDTHEVGVGPIHAGVIEPGHFRFSCHGEDVLHLEIQLGYQHRGIEKLFISKNHLLQRTVLAESIAGDCAIGHNLAFVSNMESLLEIHSNDRMDLLRTLALELERIAAHVGDLSAFCTDIAYQMGEFVFGALRTPIINYLQFWCGNRFGKGMLRVGYNPFPFTPELQDKLVQMLDAFESKYLEMAEKTFNSPSVLNRFEKTGILTMEQARLIGAVGLTARMAGLERDIRTSHPFNYYKHLRYKTITLPMGDVFARGMLRNISIERSINYIRAILTQIYGLEQENLKPRFDLYDKKFKSNQFCISLIESWRGEICHCSLTDENGNLLHYKIKDPSFHNWLALGLALRENEISDFPICNKSFDLSYCGNDL